MDIHNMPFENNVFDVVLCNHVLEHVKDDILALKEIRRVLKKDGKMILTTPNILMSLSRNPWHFREYTPFEMNEIQFWRPSFYTKNDQFHRL